MVSGGADAALREKRPYASPQASFAGLRCERARSRHKPIFRLGAFALPNHPLGLFSPRPEDIITAHDRRPGRRCRSHTGDRAGGSGKRFFAVSPSIGRLRKGRRAFTGMKTDESCPPAILASYRDSTNTPTSEVIATRFACLQGILTTIA
jgi:hypothetical protein